MLKGLLDIVLAAASVKSLADNRKDVTKMTAEEKRKFFAERRMISDVRNVCYLLKKI